MNLHRWFATVLLILALVGCVQMATGPGQALYAPYSPASDENMHDRGGDGGGGGDM
jgi:hypothetical protein